MFLLMACWLVGSLLVNAPRAAQPGLGFASGQHGTTTASSPTGLQGLLDAWSALTDVWLLVDMLVVLGLALLLGAVIAYHPAARRSLFTLERFEQPKTLLIYVVVAAVVAQIVQVHPNMAFVIFGIGGLLRFRTLLADAKDTGRVILVTVVGLCCGLKIFVVAVPATIVGWLLIFFLEQQIAGTIRVSGVAENLLPEATRTYRSLILQAGCRVIGEHTRFVKREFVFVVKAPARLNRDQLQGQFDQIAPELRGVVDWEGL
jgi:hypothetical protein